MKNAIIRLWQAYSNVFSPERGKYNTELVHIWWNEPLSVFLREVLSRLKQRFLPDVHLPPSPKLPAWRRRLRILLVLVVSALVYGLLNGWDDVVMMFVSLPAGDYPGSRLAGNLYFFASVFLTVMIHNFIYRLLFGEGEDALCSVDGVLFLLMDFFFLNIVDEGMVTFAALVDGMKSPVAQWVFWFLSGVLAITVFGELTSSILTMFITAASAYIMGLMSSVTFYLCLPVILLVQFIGLSELMPLEFFYSSCILLIGMGISVLLERLGLMQRIKWLCFNLSKVKVFILIPYLLLPFAVVYGVLTGKL